LQDRSPDLSSWVENTLIQADGLKTSGAVLLGDVAEESGVQQAARDLFLAQPFARHASPLTTVVYTHPSDEEMRDRLRGLGC